MNKENIINYLDEQFWKHKVYECMPENETGYEYVPREALSKIVDGLIPLVITELKNSSIPNVDNNEMMFCSNCQKWVKPPKCEYCGNTNLIPDWTD